MELCFQQHEAFGILNVLLQVVKKGLSYQAFQMTSSSMDMLEMASSVVERPLADWEGTLASILRALKD